MGDLRIDLAGRTAALAGQPVELTPKEFDLLSMLAEQPGRAYSREYLLTRIWGEEYIGFDRTVDTHIVRLRRKLGSHGRPHRDGVGRRIQAPGGLMDAGKRTTLAVSSSEEAGVHAGGFVPPSGR